MTRLFNNIGKPRNVYQVVPIVKSTSNVTFALTGPPKKKQWQVFMLSVQPPANTQIVSFKLNGENLGLYAVGAYAEFDFTSHYGANGILIEYGDVISVDVSNSTAADVNVGLSLYIKEYDI